MKPFNKYLIFIYSIATFISLETAHHHLKLSAHDAEIIGKKIWQNESAGKIEGLTFWKDGEDWASVGIGHFIWYPNLKTADFTEGFPLLIKFMKEKHYKKIPRWLLNKHGTVKPCPWNCREDFTKDFNSERMLELRQFLVDTISLQAEFIAKRLVWSFPKIVQNAEKDKQAHIKHQFKRLAHSPNGLYALIDYLNFKGEGIYPAENYNGKRWGLLQVLDAMQGTETGRSAIEEFAESAKQVLTDRVNNSPAERNEARWLPGWKNRIDTYKNF